MFSRLIFPVALALAIAPSLVSGRAVDREKPLPTDPSANSELHSIGTATSGLAKDAPESFWLYGEPGTGEGTFENEFGQADWQGWTSRDRTAQGFYWQVSDLNAATLGDHGPGNHAAWCGQDQAQQPGFVSGSGYGNSWDQTLVWESPPLVDPSIAQDVELEFFFHYDTELDYDFFTVVYDSAGSSPSGDPDYPGEHVVLQVSGTDFDAGANAYLAPGTRFIDQATAAIRFAGNDYGEPGENIIRLKLRFRSDSGWSDEDGLWPTNLGALWIDDIRVRWDDGTGAIQESFEDFESAGPLENGIWRQTIPPFAGDFASILPELGDLDPCAMNRSPALNFIDYGQEVRNAELAQYVPGLPTSTGGETSSSNDYGLSGGWVVNRSGGLSYFASGSGPLVPVNNSAESPAVVWDLDGTADDGPDLTGATLEFDVYEHNPAFEGMAWYWEVRSRTLGGAWSRWQSPWPLWFATLPIWKHQEWEISQFLVDDPSHVQVALGWRDISAAFGPNAGADSTPAPYFDNVRLRKYRVGGPRIAAPRSWLAQDGFPNSGLIDASSPAARDLLDVRFDMVTDLVGRAGDAIVPGDSLVIIVRSLIPSAPVTDIRMQWVLDRNPLFDDVRSLPARPGLDQNVDAIHGPQQWSGEVAASQSFDAEGIAIKDRWFFDLPDEDFLYPGDALRYAFRAEDSDGRVTTLPYDIAGLDSGVGYDTDFRVHGLPSIQDAIGAHPPMLVVDRSLHNSERDILEFALAETGWLEGSDYDVFHSVEPELGEGNSIGSAGAHGASTAQLEGYSVIIFNAGDVSFPMGDGSGNTEKSDDILRMEEWHDLAGDRMMLHLGDHLVDHLAGTSSATRNYVEFTLGVALSVGSIDFRERAAMGDPLRLVGDVVPFIASDPIGIHTGCSSIELTSSTLLGSWTELREWIPPFDIQPIAPAFTSHRIEALTSGEVASAGIVIHDREVSGDRKVDITVQIPLMQMIGFQIKAAGTQTPRSRLLLDLLSYMGTQPSGVPVDSPPALENRFSIAPNPFNPSTEIKLSLAQRGEVTVRAFDVRGRAVRTLHRGVLEAGIEHRLSWDGRDDRGESLASGVYFVSIDAPGFSRRQKVSLIK